MKFYTIFIILLFSLTAFGQKIENESETLKNPFIVKGEVTNIEINEKTYSSEKILLSIDFKMFAKNISEENVIVLSAFNEELTVEFVDDNGERLARFGLPTAGFLPNRKKIENQLNKKSPPKKYTKVLAPDQIWTFDFQFSYYIPIKLERSAGIEIIEDGRTLIITDFNFDFNISLEEIEKLSPFYIKATSRTSLIPFNSSYIEWENFNYFDMWRNKWKNYGNLWTGVLTSEPIIVDINKAIRK